MRRRILFNKILGRYLPGVSSEGAQCISPRTRSRFHTLLVPGRIVVEVLWLLFVSVPSLPASQMSCQGFGLDAVVTLVCILVMVRVLCSLPTRVHTRTHAHRHARTHTCTHAHRHARTHTYAHTRTHTTHTHTYNTHTHTYNTHTHTSLSQPYFSL